MGMEWFLQLSSFVVKVYYVFVLLLWVVDKFVDEVFFIIEWAFENNIWKKVGWVIVVVGQCEFSFWDVCVQLGEVYEYCFVNELDGVLFQVFEFVIFQVDNLFDEYFIILGLFGFIGYIVYQIRNFVY